MTASEWTSAAWGLLRRRKADYRSIPEGVIADLAKFCRATKPTFHEDPRVHALLEGRREVFLRIMEHRNLPTEELYRLYGGVAKQE
jgi:hypothetical protein